MSCGAEAGTIVKLSGLSVKIHSSDLVDMPTNSKVSAVNGTMPTKFMTRKQEETLLGSYSSWKWRRKYVFFWPFVAAATMVCIALMLSLRGGLLEKKAKSLDSFRGTAQVLMQHFNVSEDLLPDLASLSSESDQLSSTQCSKKREPEMAIIDDIACALKVLNSEMQEFQRQGKWVVEDQCPIPDWDISKPIEQSLRRESLSHFSLSTISAILRVCLENIKQTRQSGDCAEDHCKLLVSFSIKGCLVVIGMIASLTLAGFYLKFLRNQRQQIVQLELAPLQRQPLLQLKQQHLSHSPPKSAGKWRKKFLIVFVVVGVLTSIWLFWYLNRKNILWREETLANMCDERARMLQDQFNVSMNHVHALAILVSTFHHGKDPSAIDQKTFGEYTERTAFERPLTSGVAYALKVAHSEREQFEKRHGWTIKKMETEDQTLVQDCIPENLDPAPVQDEYAPVIFSQETVSHIVSIDMMSGKEDRENILRARASGKGVLTSPFKLLKSNHLGVVLTFAVYNADLPPDATPEQRTEATVGYLGASYDVPSLVEKLLHQLASKQTIVVNVYDTTNASSPILMYGADVNDTGLLRISSLDFGDPSRRHEMHCRFKQKPPLPWTAINTSAGVLVITLLVGHIFRAAISRIAKVEEDYRQMMELKARAEAADVAKSQFLATVSHEIRTPMNGVLGMLQMLMDTDLDPNQMDYAQTAHASGKDLISLINEVLDQAKIESGRLELEAVPFDLRSVLDNVLSLFSGRSNEKGIELAVYVSNRLPEVVVGDPGRFRQIITNLVGNSIKFTHDKGHIFVSVLLADEVKGLADVKDPVLKQCLNLVDDTSNNMWNTLSGFPVVERWKSWENFRRISSKDTLEEAEMITLLVTVEDTGVGIPVDAQSRIFTPFMQADSSTSRTYGGTGIGLSICKCLVDLMGGEIGFVSEPGIGSTFSFTVSFRKGETSSLDTWRKPYDPAVVEFRGLKALLIDKRSIRSEVTRYHLHRLGITADVTSDLRSAWSYLSSACHSSIPGDLAMVLIDKEVWDEESGTAFHLLLRKPMQNGGREILLNLPKVFLLATSIGADKRSELISAGLVDNILMKPLRLSVLVSCFQEALASGKKSQVTRKKPSNLRHLLRGKRILVVDDNLVNRRVAEGALKKYGAIVTCVDSGMASLKMLKPPHNFDACFMDFQMPEMDGFEATRRIRSMEKQVNEQIASGEASMEMFGNVPYWHTPILAMTADVIQATSEECVKCGMDDYVSKPFEEEQLYNAVARFFDSACKSAVACPVFVEAGCSVKHLAEQLSCMCHCSREIPLALSSKRISKIGHAVPVTNLSLSKMSTFWPRIMLLALLVISITPRYSDGQFEQWCVADEQTPDDELQMALDWACGKGGADCSQIQLNQSCYFPNTIRDHASYAFNNYFQKFKNKGGSCYFKGAAMITELDPSHGSCHYEFIP
ncbi:Histidine kinase 2 [Turnera subulata]|uniref:histidine kinase n=1 Tax=Turnera subulata TaxID=218843 RepID=A0A9Q0FLM7_9ROSI|nr:Histidine kinase 2 [Turnera subulata]